MISEPRKHHYDYAHKMLPMFIWPGANEVLAILSGPRADDFLAATWNAVGKLPYGNEQLPENERLDPLGLTTCFVRKYGEEFVIAVIALPPPAGRAEAFFVAPVFHLAGGPGEDGVSLSRYFTLEAHWDFIEQRNYTLLGKWRSESEMSGWRWRSDKHVNHGIRTVPADPEAFFLRVCSLL